VVELISGLLKSGAGVKPDDIGVMATYRKQASAGTAWHSATAGSAGAGAGAGLRCLSCPAVPKARPPCSVRRPCHRIYAWQATVPAVILLCLCLHLRLGLVLY
jgi:hypothetical protein